MTKQDAYQKELMKLNDIFKDVDETKRKLVEGLIEDAAFIKAENKVLRESIDITGMVKIHPQHPEVQKPLDTAKQYLKNINSYAVVIKTLNGVLTKGIIEEEDDMEEFE